MKLIGHIFVFILYMGAPLIIGGYLVMDALEARPESVASLGPLAGPLLLAMLVNAGALFFWRLHYVNSNGRDRRSYGK